MTPSRPRRAARSLGVAAVAVVVAAGCGSGAAGPSAAGPAGPPSPPSASSAFDVELDRGARAAGPVSSERCTEALVVRTTSSFALSVAGSSDRSIRGTTLWRGEVPGGRCDWTSADVAPGGQPDLVTHAAAMGGPNGTSWLLVTDLPPGGYRLAVHFSDPRDEESGCPCEAEVGLHRVEDVDVLPAEVSTVDSLVSCLDARYDVRVGFDSGDVLAQIRNGSGGLGRTGTSYTFAGSTISWSGRQYVTRVARVVDRPGLLVGANASDSEWNRRSCAWSTDR